MAFSSIGHSGANFTMEKVAQRVRKVQKTTSHTASRDSFKRTNKQGKEIQNRYFPNYRREDKRIEIQKRYFPNYRREKHDNLIRHEFLTKTGSYVKVNYIREAVALCRKKGFKLHNLVFEISEAGDLKLEKEGKKAGEDLLGLHTPPTETQNRHSILLRKKNPRGPVDMDWGQNETSFTHPVWGKNVYSGLRSHAPLHEIGHYLHELEMQKLFNFEQNRQWITKNLKIDSRNTSIEEIYLKLVEKLEELSKNRPSENKLLIDAYCKNVAKSIELKNSIEKLGYRELTKEERQLVLKEMGRDYLTKNSSEFVAEMFAGLVGGKTFSFELSALYKKCHGPTSYKMPV
jgi:hypothetical protein